MISDTFQFNGRSLSEFGMQTYAPEKPDGFVSRSSDYSDISSIRSVPSFYAAYYSDVLTISFLILKDTCIYDDNNAETMQMSGDEIHNVRAWLESPKFPRELVLPIDDGMELVHYFGIFSDVQPYIYDDVCYGLELTFQCNAPYGFTELMTKQYEIGIAGTTTGVFKNHSAELNDYLWPKVYIYSADAFNGDEEIQVVNNSNNGEAMALIMPSGVSTLILDCQKKFITDENGKSVRLSAVGLTIPDSSEYNIVSAESYDFYWLRMVPGENELSFISSSDNISEIDIEARFPRKVGAF